MPRHPAHILELAKRGAQARLRDLVQEAKYLINLFPHLRDSVDKDELPVSFIVARDAGRANKKKPQRRRRRKMSAAARKAVSVRMTKYWATRRKAAAKA
jgi:hypothetical protein